MKTVSLELATKLKEAGYQQDSWCWWNDDQLVVDTTGSYKDVCIAAPTADEILDFLPRHIYIHPSEYKLEISKTDLLGGVWFVMYRPQEVQIVQSDDVLANAAARMWLYLKKEGLL